jgi:hypothetical protein
MGHDIDAGTQEGCTLTRVQVAKRLGISTSSVRRLEWDQLHPAVDARGVHRFDPAEVDRVARPHRSRIGGAPGRKKSPRRGRLAAEVFRMFGRHMTLAQIVVATKQPPALVRNLYREWSTSLDEGEWTRRRRQDP